MYKTVKVFGGIFVAAAVLAGAAPFVWAGKDTGIPGVRLNGTAVGGMGKVRLEEFFREKNEELAAKKLALNHGAVHEEWLYKDLNVHFDKNRADELLRLGKTGNLLSDWITRWKAVIYGDVVGVAPLYDREALCTKVDELAVKYGQTPKEAMPVIKDDGTVEFTEGVPYLVFDRPKLVEIVGNALVSEDTDAVEIPVTEEKMPMLTKERLKNFNTVLGVYTTNFGESPNRSRNIELAAEAISGSVVDPGTVFSYNDTTGERSPDKGYLEAPVIVNGKPQPGYGGGVCQVSTTLFNAVLLSGMEVTERSPHFSPASYVPIGQDATVSYGDLDFQFINNFKNPVYVYTKYEPGAVTCWIIGAREDKPEESRVLLEYSGAIGFNTQEKVDPVQTEEKTVEYGHEGYNAEILQYARWADGRVYERSFPSYYDPVDTVITYNKDPKKAEAEKKAAAEKKAKEVKERQDAGRKTTEKNKRDKENKEEQKAVIISLGN